MASAAIAATDAQTLETATTIETASAATAPAVQTLKIEHPDPEAHVLQGQMETDTRAGATIRKRGPVMDGAETWTRIVRTLETLGEGATSPVTEMTDTIKAGAGMMIGTIAKVMKDDPGINDETMVIRMAGTRTGMEPAMEASPTMPPPKRSVHGNSQQCKLMLRNSTRIGSSVSQLWNKEISWRVRQTTKPANVQGNTATRNS